MVKTKRLPAAAIFFGIALMVCACRPTVETALPPAETSPAAPSATHKLDPTHISPVNVVQPVPEDTATADIPAPTVPAEPFSTSPPFLPTDLGVIGPGNIHVLKLVAALTDVGASVAAYTADSRLFAAGLFTTNQVKIWDLEDGSQLFSLGGHFDPRIISYLAFSPDGSKLASAAQGWDARNDSLVLWDTGSGGELQRFNGTLGAVSPDWRLLALARRKQAELTLSDLSSGEEIHSLKAPGDIYGVSFSPQGERLAARMPDVFQDLFAFWLVDSGQLDRSIYDWLEFSYSPDGRFIAALVDDGASSDQGVLNVFDGNTFKWIKTLTDNADSLWFTNPAFSPDRGILAASVEGKSVVFWDTSEWKSLGSIPVSGPAGLLFSPDGRTLTVHTHHDPVQFWGVVGD